jgi:4-amino-4-deoxy-L-arabinose transferase-like glycosyltransferase
MRKKRYALALTAIATILAGIWLLTGWWCRAVGGLRFEALADNGATVAGTGTRAIGAPAASVDAPERAYATWRWSGWWVTRVSGRYRLKARMDGALLVRVDGREVLAAKAPHGGRSRERVEFGLAEGVHTVAITWTSQAKRQLRVVWRAPRGGLRNFDDALLFRRRPATAMLALESLRPWLLALALVALLGAVLCRWPPTGLVRWASGLVTPRRARGGAVLLMLLIVGYGAALRLEALVVSYWTNDAPAWAVRLSTWVKPLRPESFRWRPLEHPYKGGDPGAYIRYGREMTGLYEPRVREPLFVLATKVGMALVGGRDVGVSLASTFFSVLVLALTYLVGAYAFSRVVGLGAALALAIERQAIAQGVSGWRDEAFAGLVLVVAYAVLRLLDHGRFRDAVLLGLGGGLACLTRITSPTLVVPVVLMLVVFPRSRPWRRRLELAATAGLVALVVAGPFMLSCWLGYGDPFYSINEHVVFYRTRAHLVYEPGMTVLDYLRESFRPFQLLDTAFIGYTKYPFASRWTYQDWSPHLGPLLAGAAMAGLALFLGSRRGRVLLLVHAAAMFPFVFTHETRLGGPWRLTFHAYPIYLLAAFWALYLALQLALSSRARGRLLACYTPRRAVLVGSGLVGLLVTSWGLWNGLRYLRLAEAVEAGQAVIRPPAVVAGPRDAFFFGEGWHPLVSDPEWPGRYARYSRGTTGTVRLPLVAGRGYRLGLRLDPLFADAGQMPTVDVSLNGRHLDTLHLKYRPEKVGHYVVDVPAAAVRDGANRLTLTASQGLRAGKARNAPRVLPRDWSVALAVQYVVIRPEGQAPDRAEEVERGEQTDADGEGGSAED